MRCDAGGVTIVDLNSQCCREGETPIPITTTTHTIPTTTTSTTTTTTTTSTTTTTTTTSTTTTTTTTSTTTTTTTTTKSGPCEAGQKYLNVTNKCYEVVSTRLSWSQALSSCRADGGDLASILDQETNDFIQSLITSKTWVGGYRVVDDQSVWGWTDGSVWSYENWSSNNPDNAAGVQDCVGMYPAGNWDDDSNSTSASFAYVCQFNTHEGCAYDENADMFLQEEVTSSPITDWSWSIRYERNVSNTLGWPYYSKMPHGHISGIKV